MPRLVERGGREVLDGVEARVEAARRDERVDELLRHPLARLVVHRVAREDLGPQQPQLVHLARQLDEVAVDAGAGLRRVPHPREEAVQGVPELVEQRLGLVERQQRRLAGRGLGDVEVVHDHREVAGELGLRDERAHPRTAALRVAGVRIEEVEADRRAVLLEHLEDARVGVVADEVVARGEAQAVRQRRGVEHAVDEHAVEFEVRAQRREVEVVPLGAHLLGEERPVGRGGLARAGGVGPRGELGAFARDVAHRGRGELGEERGDGLGGARRLAGGDRGGVVREPEQPGALGAQVHEFEQRRPGVVRAAAASARP